jgi:plasmid stabilization system protein ParE
MNLSYTERAKTDIETALLWYEKQRDGLGFDFIDCIKEAEGKIKENPEIYAFTYSAFRGCVIRRFPFSIYYTIENNNKEIVVHSVFDNRQDPIKKP